MTTLVGLLTGVAIGFVLGRRRRRQKQREAQLRYLPKDANHWVRK